MTNPIEQWIEIQSKYKSGQWGATQRFSMREIQQAFTELGKHRANAPKSEIRLVSIAVTLLSEQGEGER